MKQKIILFLGGAYSQIPAIEYAKRKGLKVITVDYLPGNPGHKFSDEYYNISTIDKAKILDLAVKLKIDAISAYASDPSAPTAAFVCDKLGLVGGGYASVSVLSDKALFRRFLSDNNLPSPWFTSGTKIDDLLNHYPGGKAILKPVDSSGSKGVALVECQTDIIKAFEIAKQFSHSDKVILEQFIEKKGPQLHGEGFVVNGKIVFLLLGDQIFSTLNPFAPYSTTLPGKFHEDILPSVYSLIEIIIQKVGFHTGGINIEVLRDKNDQLFVIEIGARSGGNFMPQLMFHASGFNIVEANIDAPFGENVKFTPRSPTDSYYSQLILHSKRNGIFQGISVPAEFEDSILEKVIYYQKGDSIRSYFSSQDVVGVLILELKNNAALQNYQNELLKNNWVITS
ncbi:MAG: ATP-grasp domain-containing protein [Bacteroidales bacterium]|nr:ATP-grasp domain-containing protein [Bacteroidales bacterium]